MGQSAERTEGRQARKTRITREKILNAVVSLIKEGGFGAASSSQIARRAGVTWGAVQHHFGSKEDILEAVLALSHEQFTASMAGADLHHGSLSDRVGLFIDTMWEHYQSELYLAALEILLALRGQRDTTSALQLTEAQARTHLATMHEIFADADVADEQLLEGLVFAHCFLTGLTLERLLDPTMRHVHKHLKRIKLVMLAVLSGV